MFVDFFKEYLAAVKAGDMGFIRDVYSDWFASAGVPGNLDDFLKAGMPDLKKAAEGALAKEECFGPFCIAHMKDDSGEYSLTFRKKGDSWIFYNERTNFSKFGNVYAISYSVKGSGRLRIYFNGKRSPFVADIQPGHEGFVSLINSALAIGENELTLDSLDRVPLEVSIRVSSAKPGGVIDSAQGDVLAWEGKVEDPVRVSFKAG
ncbi:MAG: hypothetical protein AB1529_07525 [Candidatus Micrarchaeota archaeon]